MNNEEKKAYCIEAMQNQDIFDVHDVITQFDPHPYCITPKHINGAYMSLNEHTITTMEKESRGKIHCGMYVSPDGSYRNAYKKGYTPCTIPYSEHKSFQVLILKLKRNATNDEVNALFKSIADKLNKEIAGIAFLETEEKFRIE